MPYEMIWESDQGLHKRFYGELSVNDVIQSSIELHRDPRFDQMHYSINNFSEVTGLQSGMDTSQLDDLSAATIGASFSNQKLRVAIVTHNQQLEGLAHRYMTRADSTWPTKVFPTLDAARAWINASLLADGIRPASRQTRS